MTKLGPSQLSASLIGNYLFDVVKVRATTSPLLKPLIFSYYVTLRCNFHCSFCGFAQGEEISKELNSEDTAKILRVIRKACSCIYFTGGEPLIRDDITEILGAAKQLGFKSVSLNTNLSLIHRKMEVLRYIDNLVVSINQMDDKKAADTKGINIKMVQQVKENLATCLKLRKREGFSLTINCVITRESIDDTLGVMEYCLENDINFAVVPAELEYGYLDKALISSIGYRDLIKSIIRHKKDGLRVFNSFSYLDRILNFDEFTCYPMLMPHVYPNGDLFYPCQPMRHVAANMLRFNSYEDCLKEGIKKYGNVPKCKNRCYIACYIEPSIAIEHPLNLLRRNYGNLRH